MPAGARSPLLKRRMVAGLAVLVTAVAPVDAAPPHAAAATSAPTDVVAIASDGSVRLTWLYFDADSDPEDDPVGGFRITASTGAVYRATEAPMTVTRLRNGVPVTFRVAAVTRRGVGPASTPSERVTPLPSSRVDTWRTARSLHLGRFGAAATRLRDGRVVVVGGYGRGAVAEFRTLEIYDPRTGRWSTGRLMHLSRENFATTALPNGRILVTGGAKADFTSRRTAEIYDPVRNRWTVARPMLRARQFHTATLLPNGTVLVAGGMVGGGSSRATAELYDPRRNRWSATGSMHGARIAHSATLLRDGRVLVAGGVDDIELPGVRTAELYDPATHRWTTTGSMSAVHDFDGFCCEGAVRLRDGRVLVAGGRDVHRNVQRTAELYDPARGRWTVTGSLQVGRSGGSPLVVLRDGRVLAIGGADDFGALKYAETYDPRAGRWSRVNDLAHPRNDGTAVLLGNGRVLVAGGGFSLEEPIDRSAEVFVPRF
jgi:Galactose oxidase, central domain/Kelch motif